MDSLKKEDRYKRRCWKNIPQKANYNPKKGYPQNGQNQLKRNKKPLSFPKI